jgi:hypothetical protein
LVVEQKIIRRFAPKPKKEQNMKNQLILNKLTSRPGRWGSALAALLLLATVASSPAQVLPPSTLPYGLSYQEWSTKWWQWSLEQSTDHLELVGGPGICDGPASQVRFLAGSLLSSGQAAITNRVTVTDQTPLFFTILSVWDDNSGCPFTTFTAEQLRATVEGDWSAVTVTTCTIDGVPVAGLKNPTNTMYHVQSPFFSYTTAERGNVLAGVFGDTCIGGGVTIYPAVADGVYLMLSPLKPGKHTIHTVGVVGPLASPFVVEDVTYDITVDRDFGFDCR